jgi:hypothetical protein
LRTLFLLCRWLWPPRRLPPLIAVLLRCAPYYAYRIPDVTGPSAARCRLFQFCLGVWSFLASPVALASLLSAAAYCCVAQVRALFSLSRWHWRIRRPLPPISVSLGIHGSPVALASLPPDAAHCCFAEVCAVFSLHRRPWPLCHLPSLIGVLRRCAPYSCLFCGTGRSAACHRLLVFC